MRREDRKKIFATETRYVAGDCISKIDDSFFGVKDDVFSLGV